MPKSSSVSNTNRATKKIPATVVTGFLGAGKTSLIRHLIEHANGRRLAILEANDHFQRSLVKIGELRLAAEPDGPQRLRDIPELTRQVGGCYRRIRSRSVSGKGRG